MESTVLTAVALPIALGIVMLGLGLGLTLDDFKRVFRSPKAAVVGLGAQLIMLPALGYVIAKAFNMPGELAVGLMILALCPGGVTSNLFSLLARGDVALSVSLTAVSSLVTPFTIPLVGGWAMTSFLGASSAISMNFVETVLKLMVVTIVPVAIGMGIRHWNAGLAERADRAVRILSSVILALLIAGVLLGIVKKHGWGRLGEFFVAVGWPALTLNILAIAAGVGIGALARLRRQQVITVGIEVGFQNGTTALIVTLGILKSETMAISPSIYSLIMFATGTAFAFLVTSKLLRPKDSVPQGT